jgi:uncharacterized membrane protein
MANVFRNLHGSVTNYDHGASKLKQFLLFGVVFLAALGLQLATGVDHRMIAMMAFLAVLASWAALWRLVRHDGGSPYWIGAVMGGALLLAVAFAPSTSKDVNSYALYGRMVATYEASPYTHLPIDFAADPWFGRTSWFWSDSPSVYGPVFTSLSAGIMSVAGTSELTARLGFQGLAALALLGSVLAASTRLGAPRAMVLIGLNPVLLTFGVNDAHCDVLIGFFVLAAVLSLMRREYLIGGVLLAFAASVKIAVLPAVAGAFVWIAFRHQSVRSRLRDLVRFSIGFIVVFVGLLLAFGGADALAPLLDATGRHTRFSFWNPLHDIITNNSAAALPMRSTADAVVSVLASATVALVGITLIWRHRNDVEPVVAVAVGLVVYQLFGAYVLSWYAAWSLPTLALMSGSRSHVLAMAHASWVAIAYFNGYGAVVVILALAVVWLVRGRPGVTAFWAVPHSESNRGMVASP